MKTISNDEIREKIQLTHRDFFRLRKFKIIVNWKNSFRIKFFVREILHSNWPHALTIAHVLRGISILYIHPLIR